MGILAIPSPNCL